MPDPDALARLRALILTDEAAAERLARIADPADFAAAACDLAASAGIAISADEVAAAAKPDPLGLDRFDDAPPNADGWPGPRWLPAAIVAAQGQFAVDWLHFGDDALTGPFFAEPSRRAQGLPINRLIRVRTPLAVLTGKPPADAARAPDGLIFHMSRCGSTLVSRMLAAMPGAVAISEASPLDTLVQLLVANPQIPLDQRAALLRGMAAALGRDRFGERRHYFIKTNAWHSLALPLFRAAFPETPWLFLFREPVEVLVSQMRLRGAETVPGALPPAVLPMPDSTSATEEDQVAQVLASVNRAAIDHADIGGGLFVDYADLPDAVERDVLPHFAIAPDSATLVAMRGATARNAKSPARAFEADGANKRREANGAIRTAAATHLDALHDTLMGISRR